MALIVEDGNGLAAADSYNSLEDIAAYAAAHGLAFSVSPAEPAEAAARRAVTWLDGVYRDRFPGTRTNGRAQALQWPRVDAVDVDGEEIADNVIPAEIKAAHCVASIREFGQPGGLTPDYVATAQAIRKKVGPIEVEYSETGRGPDDVRPVVNLVEDILAPLLGGRSNAAFLLRA